MRYFREFTARARLIPFHLLIVKINCFLVQKAKQIINHIHYSFFPSYSLKNPGFEESLISPPDSENIKTSIPRLAFLIKKIMNHEFNLLGSGWQKVYHGVQCAGLNGHLYSPHNNQWSHKQLKEAKHINVSNRRLSKKISSLIKKDYQWIDWQLDFKSGYRWQNNQWWNRIPYGHKPGVDIKVPWELSRMQHLPLLAYAYGLASENPSFLDDSPRKFMDEFESQILDFIANNPPHFGVNWKCPMDIAIRGANWVLALDIFRSFGAGFSKEFLSTLSSSLYDHGQFVFNHFEKGIDFRGNHYLANIAGLSFIAFYLKPSDKNISLWRKTCLREIKKELDYQFHDCGTNFEGSTAYHRLSTEMLVYPIILFSLHPSTKDKQYLNQKDLKKIIGMSFFMETLTKPDGHIVQIGDNDSGRFFKLNPVFTDNGEIREKPLEVSHIRNIIKSLFTGEFNEIEGELTSYSLKKNHTLNKDCYTKRNPSPTENPLKEDSVLKTESPLKGNPVSKKTYPLNEKSYPTIIRDFEQSMGLSQKKEIPHNLSKAKILKRYFFTPPENYREGLRYFVFSDFGVAVYKSPHFFLSFRCGPVGQRGRGGHDHNDQLSIELFYNNRNIITDPGTFLYTAEPNIRNTYRSNRSHFCPQPKNSEMGNLDKGLFFIENASPGHLVSWDRDHVLGHFEGFGFPIYRKIILEKKIIIEDYFFENVDILDLNSFENKDYSEGYGLRSTSIKT